MFGNCGARVIYRYCPEPPHEDGCNKKKSNKQSGNCTAYVEPKVVLTLKSPAEYENGETVSTLEFSWVYSKPDDTLVSQDINGWKMDTSQREAKVLANISQSTIYTITVNDGSSTATDSVEVRFKDYVYCSVGKTVGNMQKVKSCKAFFTAGEGEYLWIFVPTSTGITKFLFDHNVDVVSDFTQKPYVHTNDAGKAVEGILYQSVNYSLGTLTLKFK